VNIYLGNLSYRTTEAELKEAFAQFGEVRRAKIVKDRETEISDILDLPCEENFSCDIDNKDTLKNILCYLNTLTKKERDVIIYRIWYDLSFSEISEILGLSLDNCKKISSRTLKKISANFLSFLFIFLIF